MSCTQKEFIVYLRELQNNNERTTEREIEMIAPVLIIVILTAIIYATIESIVLNRRRKRKENE